MKRPYPFSQECLPVPSFRCKLPECCVGPVSRSHEAASSSDECSVNVEEGNVLKRFYISPGNRFILILGEPDNYSFWHFYREVVSKSRALSESEPSVSVRETKGLNGDFLRLAPPAAALPHLEAVNRRSITDSAPQCLQLFDYVPSRVRLKDFSIYIHVHVLCFLILVSLPSEHV